MSNSHVISASAAHQAALLGHTGFVGGALLRQRQFEACFNSANIAESAGEKFSEVVCAAAPGSMLEANIAPDQDRAKIMELIDQLSKIRADRFVLISSIAVLADFASGADESSADFQQELAYGRHRRLLEAFVEEHFEDSLIVRLPALFGEGLRKNLVFDLLNPVPSMLKSELLDQITDTIGATLADLMHDLYSLDEVTGMCKLDREALNAHSKRAALEDAVVDAGASATQFHNPETTYQYYEIERLWADIEIAREASLSHIHLVAEPLPVHVIHQCLTGRVIAETGARLHREDMRTRYAALWGSEGPYQFSSATTLERLSRFFSGQKVPA
ncbi:MAG: hypothetical protein AAF697_02900 [Pseudomonadota bacterium]